MTGGLLGYAFTLGVLAAINPCGFALLPIYVTQFTSANDTTVSPGRRILRAVATSATVAMGFVIVFAVVGAAVMTGMAVFLRWVPWVMAIIAVGLVAAGIAGLTGRLTLRMPALRWSIAGRSPKSMLLFGVGYALASLSCALPVFLAGVAGAFLRNSPLSGLMDFLAYAAGMAVLLTGVSVVIALGGATRLRNLRRLSRWLTPVPSILLILMGGYLLYYWITYLVAPQQAFPLTGLVENVQAGVTSRLGAGGIWVGVGIVCAVALIALTLWLRRYVGTLIAVMSTLTLPALLMIAIALISATSPRSTVTTSSDSPFGVGSDVQYTTALTPTGTARAPAFTLTDQHGKRMSPTDFHGRVAIFAFLDAKCQDTCLLYAPDVLDAARRLGPVNRQVEFVGINVNPQATAVSDVADFSRRTHLDRLPNWHFLTGSPQQLKTVWRDYGEFVSAKGAGVTHDGVLAFVDPNGRQRAVGSFGGSSQASQRWGLSLATITRALLDVPFEPPKFNSPGPDDPTLRGVDVRGSGSAPEVKLPRLLQPQSYVSLAALRGKPVVVNFWASWCPPCRRELPTLRAEADRYRGRATFVGIDIDDRAEDARNAARDAGLNYTLLEDADGRAAGAYQVVNLPTTVIIAPDGTVSVRHTGAISRNDLEGALDRSLANIP